MKVHIRIIVSLLFLGCFLIHLFCPNIVIDSVAIVLLILAVLPWIIENIKSIELSGIGKLELIDKDKMEKIDKKAQDAGIFKMPSSVLEKYQFYSHRYDDPRLALAGLRIHLEDCLRRLAEKSSITEHRGLRQLIDVLYSHQDISNDERVLLNDMLGILNNAVHSKMGKYDSDSFDWVFDMGMKVLISLEAKIK